MVYASNNKRYLGRTAIACAVLCVCFVACAQNQAQNKAQEIQAEEPKSEILVGAASYYAAKFHGKRTASGETFNSKSMTAAHRTLPFGTKLKVTNLRNKKFVIVRVNDRGPHVRGRIVDISRTAAELIGMRRTGTARVKLEVLQH